MAQKEDRAHFSIRSQSGVAEGAITRQRALNTFPLVYPGRAVIHLAWESGLRLIAQTAPLHIEHERFQYIQTVCLCVSPLENVMVN
jgi:hypothetical protein